MNTTSHWIYLSALWFAAISMEEISACVGLSLGITASKENLDLGVSLTHSACKQKGLLNTGTAAGLGSPEAPWVTWAQTEIRAGSHKVRGWELWCHPPDKLGPQKLWVHIFRSIDPS